MRKSILIIATVVLGLTTLNATNLKMTLNSEISVEINDDNIVEVYDWKVTTRNGESSGTAQSLEEAKRMIKLFSNGEIVLEQQITSFKMLASEASNNNNRLYYWKVESNYGNSDGFASSEATAKKMIALVAKGDIVSYKVIASKKL